MNSTKLKITHARHLAVHKKLHEALDRLLADWIQETGVLPTRASVGDLIDWSHKQTTDPDNNKGYVLPPDHKFKVGDKVLVRAGFVHDDGPYAALRYTVGEICGFTTALPAMTEPAEVKFTPASPKLHDGPSVTAEETVLVSVDDLMLVEN